MGSQRRQLAQLQRIGVPAYKEMELSDAIDTLRGAGDSYVDDLWDWLSYYDDPDKEISETEFDGLKLSAALGLTASLSAQAQAVGKLIAYLNGS